MVIIAQKFAIGAFFVKITHLKIFQVVFFSWLQLIFRANLDTNAANAPSADILEVLFHIPRAFFRVKISLSVRRRFYAVNRACRASVLTKLTITTAVFDNGQFVL